MKNNKLQSAKFAFASAIVSTMTFDNIKAILKNLSLPVDKSKVFAAASLVQAIMDKKANCSIHLAIRTPRDEHDFQNLLFSVKTRTHKDDEAPIVRPFTPAVKVVGQAVKTAVQS